MDRQVLRIKEVAELLDVSPSAIRAACKRGQIPTIALPGVWLIPTAAVEEMLKRKLKVEETERC